MNDLLTAYSQVAGQSAISQLMQLAEKLKGTKTVHINSTKMGGGVAEILSKMVPLSTALMLETKWDIIEGNVEFFNCTKSFHNGLQGEKVFVLQHQLQNFEKTNQENVERLKPILEDADFVFIHDPQPLPLINYFPKHKGKWIWRCHIDAGKPFRPIWNYLKQFIQKYDASIFSMAEFSHILPHPMFIILPSIDPLSDKNRQLKLSEIEAVCEKFSIEKNHPLLLQVSRFDRFKDPVGVIQAFRLVKKFKPTAQLVLAGGGASDDPEGEIVLKEVLLAAGDDPNIHVLLLPNNAHLTINALQSAADIILQKSTKEGFGLTVSEGLWKGKPVIGGNTGGIKVQIINWKTGFLVNTPEGAASRIRYLLQNPSKREAFGVNGKEYVREQFLLTRQLREYLTLMNTLK